MVTVTVTDPTPPVVAGEAFMPGSVPRTSVQWQAILAGVAILLAVTIILNMLGVGVGLAIIDPMHPYNNPDAKSFAIGSGLWWVVSNWIAVGCGALIAGRLAHRFLDSDGALHGLTVWATGLVLTFMLLAGLAGSAVGDIGRTAQTVAASPATANIGDPMQMLTARSDSPDALQAQIRRFVANPDSVNRADLVHAIATQAGISDEEADARLNRFTQDMKVAADQAARTTAQIAIWGCVSLLIGALAAYLGGLWGARAGREAELRAAASIEAL